jgi:hypothetical protein
MPRTAHLAFVTVVLIQLVAVKRRKIILGDQPEDNRTCAWPTCISGLAAAVDLDKGQRLHQLH